MSTRAILVAVLSTGLCATAAFAQSTTTSPAPPATTTATTPTPADAAQILSQSSSPANHTIEHRLQEQQDRIQAGVKDGQLTQGEATKLTAHDAAIVAQAKADRQANGGKLTAEERTQLKKELNHNSKQIARARHNNATPATTTTKTDTTSK